MRELTVTAPQAGQRLDKFLMKYLDKAPQSFIFKMMRKKNIVLNDGKCTGAEKLETGDHIKLYFREETFAEFQSQAKKQPAADHKKAGKAPKLNLHVLFENEDYLAVDKPAGILSQKSKPGDYSVNDWLGDYLISQGNKAPAGADFKPSVANRLDRNTSGIILCAKTRKGAQMIGEGLRSRTIHKEYSSIVIGKLEQDLVLEDYLLKDEKTNKVALSKEEDPDREYVRTDAFPVRTFTYAGQELTYVKLILHTGKSHQIRAQMQKAGYPLLGEPKYANQAQKAFGRKLHLDHQLLHARKVTMQDGTVIEAKEPAIYAKIRQEAGI